MMSKSALDLIDGRWTLSNCPLIRRSEFQTLGHSAEIDRGLPSLRLASSFGRRVMGVFNAMGAGASSNLEHGASTSASIPKSSIKILIVVGTVLS